MPYAEATNQTTDKTMLVWTAPPKFGVLMPTTNGRMLLSPAEPKAKIIVARNDIEVR